MIKKQVPLSSIKIMLASLSENTIKQYDTCLKKWFLFCTAHDIGLFEESVPNILIFLTEQFQAGAQYGTLNSCKSALSLILGTQIANDDRIKRLFKGIFRLRPPLPKYHCTWDTSLVLDHLAQWYPNQALSLEKITKKLVTLLALITAHRVQTLSKINIKNIEKHSDKIVIKIPDLIKTSRVGSKQPTLVLPYFHDKPEICPVNTLDAYLNITDPLRIQHSNLFISLRKPHSIITSQTLSRWVKNTLEECGVDVSIFTAHSTRHAATSKAFKLGVNIDLIRKTAGWTGSSNTFGRFYQREVNINNVEQTSFARSIVSGQSPVSID